MTAPFTSPDNRNLLIAKGELYLDIHVGSLRTGYYHTGNLDSLTANVAPTFLDKRNTMKASADLYARRLQRMDIVLRAGIGEFTYENYQLLFMANPITEVSVATPVVDEELTDSAVSGGYYKLGGFGPYTAVSVDAEGTPLVQGTGWDWYDEPKGIIRLLTAGTPGYVVGDVITASYTPTAYTTIKAFSGGTKSVVEATGLFLPDPSTGPKVMYEFWNLSVTPEGEIPLISEEWAAGALNMAAQNDAAGNWGGSTTYPIFKGTILPY